MILGLGFIAYGHFYLGNTIAGWGFTIAALIPLLAILLMWLISFIDSRISY